MYIDTPTRRVFVHNISSLRYDPQMPNYIEVIENSGVSSFIEDVADAAHAIAIMNAIDSNKLTLPPPVLVEN